MVPEIRRRRDMVVRRLRMATSAATAGIGAAAAAAVIVVGMLAVQAEARAGAAQCPLKCGMLPLVEAKGGAGQRMARLRQG